MGEVKLVIKKETVVPVIPSEGRRPIAVSAENYRKIKMIADETNRPISKVAGLLLDFALENVVIEK